MLWAVISIKIEFILRIYYLEDQSFLLCHLLIL